MQNICFSWAFPDWQVRCTVNSWWTPVEWSLLNYLCNPGKLFPLEASNLGHKNRSRVKQFRHIIDCNSFKPRWLFWANCCNRLSISSTSQQVKLFDKIFRVFLWLCYSLFHIWDSPIITNILSHLNVLWFCPSTNVVRCACEST